MLRLLVVPLMPNRLSVVPWSSRLGVGTKTVGEVKLGWMKVNIPGSVEACLFAFPLGTGERPLSKTAPYRYCLQNKLLVYQTCSCTLLAEGFITNSILETSSNPICNFFVPLLLQPTHYSSTTLHAYWLTYLSGECWSTTNWVLVAENSRVSSRWFLAIVNRRQAWNRSQS